MARPPRPAWDKWTVNNFKSQLLHEVDITAYDYLLYLDLDVLVNTARVESMVSELAIRGAVAFQEDGIVMGRYRYETLPAGMEVPTEEERIAWGRRPICAGIMGFPTRGRGREILTAYHEMCAGSGFRGSDQAKLTILMNRRFAGEWEFLRESTFGRRVRPPYEEPLLHFTLDPEGKRLAAYHRNRLHVAPGSLRARAQAPLDWPRTARTKMRRVWRRLRGHPHPPHE